MPQQNSLADGRSIAATPSADPSDGTIIYRLTKPGHQLLEKFAPTVISDRSIAINDDQMIQDMIDLERSHDAFTPYITDLYLHKIFDNMLSVLEDDTERAEAVFKLYRYLTNLIAIANRTARGRGESSRYWGKSQNQSA
ncbi:hypothetical protein GCM10027299_42040 [Larkinella ripae]